ncbi:MAG TPA: TIGR03013 family XrtA/PEP-CTERM system glycosyltransferase [Stellaceae bacterium]|nr:TIGR03013 family XrtA/PEP-CTERM system glycosyltransferase [Stellaceae bacterium]
MLRIFRHYLSASALCLFLCESSVVVVVLYAAVNLFAPVGSTSSLAIQRHIAAVLVPGIVNSVFMYSLGLYDRWLMEDLRRALPRLIACFALCTPVIIASMTVNFVTPAGADWERALIYTSWAAAAFLGVLVARLCYVAITRATVAPNRVLVVGTGRLAAELECLMAQSRDTDAVVIGYAALSAETPSVPQARVKPLTGSLLQTARANAVKEIVVALDDRRGAPLRPLLEARMEGITITSYLSFWEREMRRINLQALDPSWLIYSDGFRLRTVTNGILKRILDIVASLALLVLTLPTLVLAAIAIRLDSPGSIFYKQERVGRHGAAFMIYKFRTMRVDAESSGVPQWAAARDPRITRVGSFLRMTRIDELPQILNVLRGDMSFVGPRPERPFFVESLSADIPFYSERHRVRPGITGWAQINYPYGASIEDAKAKLSYDLYYIKNYSFMFDLLIILSTAHAVFVKKGAR